MKSYQIEKEGCLFKVLQQGSGAPVVVIGSADFYSRVFSPSLLEQFCFYFVDFRGFARTQGPTDLTALNMELVCEDLEYVCSQLQLEKFTLIGHSAHAFIAGRYATLYPNRVSALALLCTSPRNDSQGFAEVEFLWSAVENPQRKKQRALDESRYLQTPGFVNYCLARNSMSWFDEQVDGGAYWQGVHVNEDIIGHFYMQVYPQVNLPELLGDISVPVYLGLGMHDYLVAPFYLWLPIVKGREQMKVSLFEKSGHYPMLEEASFFDQSFSSWMKAALKPRG